MKSKLMMITLTVALGGGGFVQAQEKYPVKPIRMIVGYAPGGGSDIIARLVAPQITEALGQQVIVENRAGQAQNIAAEFLIKQPADGYNLFLSSVALGVNVTRWLWTYNHERPNMALGGITLMQKLKLAA